MSPVKFHLAGEIAVNENLFVGIKTLKLTAPSLILMHFYIILSNYYNIPVHRLGFSLRRGGGVGSLRVRPFHPLKNQLHWFNLKF